MDLGNNFIDIGICFCTFMQTLLFLLFDILVFPLFLQFVCGYLCQLIVFSRSISLSLCLQTYPTECF